MQSWELTPEQIKKIIRAWIWSFSRVCMFDSCLYAAYLKYIEENEGLPNGWAQFGTTVHETIEKFLLQELDMFTASQYYQEHFMDVVTCDFPPNKYCDLKEKAYLEGLEYFNNINFDFDRYEILGVERELNFMVGDYKFHGFADAIYRDRETDEIILRDHKTSSFKFLKSGEISKGDQPHFLAFKRQLYLYSIPLVEEYGKVDKLSWNMIRNQRSITIPFNQEEFKEAQDWAISNIKQLEDETLWLPDTSNQFFCNCLCDMRNICTYRQGG